MLCPSCGHDNLAGTDRCVKCMNPLRDLDVPRPKEGLQRHIMLDTVSQLNLSHPVNVRASDSVAHAVDLMRVHGVGCALVLENDDLVGLFTERDVVSKVAGSDLDPKGISLGEIMTPDPAKLKSDDTIATALHKMSVGGFRHLPVTHEGKVMGLISIKDILGYIADKALHH